MEVKDNLNIKSYFKKGPKYLNSGLRPEKAPLFNPHRLARPKDLVHWAFNQQPISTKNK